MNLTQLELVVWIFDTFENNSRIKHIFTKYLKDSCWLESCQQHSLNYFLTNSLVSKILVNQSGYFV